MAFAFCRDDQFLLKFLRATSFNQVYAPKPSTNPS